MVESINYKEKYLKYKAKYLKYKNMQGGLIGDIPCDKLDKSIDIKNLPDKIKEYINLITIPNTNIIPVGSGIAKIQRFPSDIDLMNIIEKPNTEDVISFLITNLKNIVNTINNSKTVFFSDFKAGGLHWTTSEIFNEVKDNLTLREACKIIDVIKIDMFAPYNNRYLEMSTFFILKSNTGFVNVDQNYFKNFTISLSTDIEYYKEIKPFKAVKRVWSYSKIKNDRNTMKTMEKLINSNISLFSQINADIETLELMVEKNIQYDLPYVLNEIKVFKERTSHILDIDYNEQMLFNMFDNLADVVSKKEKNNILISLKNLHDYILTIINKETLAYLKTINYNFPDKIKINKNDTSPAIIPILIGMVSLIFSYI